MLVLEDVSRSYRGGREAVPVLRDVTLRIPARVHPAIHGPNGAGKTTLLQILAGQLRTGRGTYKVDGLGVSSLGLTALSRWRHENCGIVLANTSDLIPFLTGYDNIALGRKRSLRPREKAAGIASALPGNGAAAALGRRRCSGWPCSRCGPPG